MRAPRLQRTRVAGHLSVSDLLDLHPDTPGFRRARAAGRSNAAIIANTARRNGAELEPLAQPSAGAARYALPLHRSGVGEALPLRRDVEENPIARQSRRDLEARRGILHHEGFLGNDATGCLYPLALHHRPR